MKKQMAATIGAAVMAALLQAQGLSPTLAGKEARNPASPVEPVAAILAAFRSHSIVALGNVEGGNEQSHAFQLRLIRAPQFAATVNDIVVEFGNARYQDVMDRFVSGEDTPSESLRRAWQDTTQVEFEWDLPVYEELFRTVRSVNGSLPRERQIRVLLGDPPIDWDRVRSLQDLHAAMGNRDAHAVGVIRREVLAKGRRALVIYGTQHLLRKNTVIGAADEWAGGLVAQLERPAIAKVFTIGPETRRDLKALQSDVASWPKPSLAILRGTQLGATHFAAGPRQRSVPLEEQLDAVLYFGPPAELTTARLSHSLCADQRYMEMRMARLALVPPPPGAPVTPADLLREQCAPPASAIPDAEPGLTEMVAQTIRDAAQGKVDAARLAPESRERLSQFLRENGPRFLGAAGPLESLTLLADSHDVGLRVRRYRAAFGNGLKTLWTVELSPAAAIVSMTARPE
jgi:hypothetical protein